MIELEEQHHTEQVSSQKGRSQNGRESTNHRILLDGRFFYWSTHDRFGKRPFCYNISPRPRTLHDAYTDRAASSAHAGDEMPLVGLWVVVLGAVQSCNNCNRDTRAFCCIIM